MPDTEAGKRLLEMASESAVGSLVSVAIDAIEAEARKKALAEVYGYTRHCLERVRDAVEDLPVMGYEVDVRDVLAILEREG